MTELSREAARDIALQVSGEGNESLADQLMPIVRQYRAAFARGGVARAIRFFLDRGVFSPGRAPAMRRVIYYRLKAEESGGAASAEP